MLVLPDDFDIPTPVLALVLFFPLIVMTVVTMVIIGPVLSLGLLAIMATTAGIVWLGSRGTDWMQAEDQFDNYEPPQ